MKSYHYIPKHFRLFDVSLRDGLQTSLAHWRVEDVADYFAANNLPPHPLLAKGYPSIGCKPCTVPVGIDDDVRSGRWQGRAKTECGIHLETKSLTPAEDMT